VEQGTVPDDDAEVTVRGPAGAAARKGKELLCLTRW
jgi:hypothetical protein